MRTSVPFLPAALLAAALGSACASAGAVPKPFPRPGQPPPARRPEAAPPSSLEGTAVARFALGLRGTPYRDGGTDPRGFDCSGFVWYVFDREGLDLPRTVADQFKVGRRIQKNHLQAGDLVFFSTVARGASHVGIAIGGDEFIHAPSERGQVRVERLTTPYWARRYVGARRPSEPIRPPDADPSGSDGAYRSR